MAYKISLMSGNSIDKEPIHSDSFFFSLLLSFLFVLHRLLCKLYYIKYIIIFNASKLKTNKSSINEEGGGW